MKAKNPTYLDGKFYEVGEEIPDLGSWRSREIVGDYRDYVGLSKDIDKLPHYVATGSTAFCADTKRALVYTKEDDTWH